MSARVNRHRIAAGITFAGLIFNVLAAAQPAPTAAIVPGHPLAHGQLVKPVWLTDFSLGLKETYDDNIFVAGADSKSLPASYTVPAGSVAARENISSWVTTISPKLGINFAPLLGGQKTLQTLSLAYAPDFVIYHGTPSENFNAHRFATAIKGRAEAFSFSAENSLVYVQGSELGPTYPGALYSAFISCFVRERRAQIQDRATAALQYDFKQGFVRPTATLLYYDLMTKQLNVSGYQSYVDRYDVNGGADLGWKIRPQLALTLGYRYGHQYQQQFTYSPHSSSSDYQRVLFGIEGKPWKWLEVKIHYGPDFRSYAANTATHTTPVNDLTPVKYYGEAILTATLTAKDTVTFKCKQWQWVSSVGKIPYFDSTYDLSYRRKLTGKLVWDLGGKIMYNDFTSGNLASRQRFDAQYSVSTSLGYAVNSHLNLNFTYLLDLGRNVLDGVTNPETRAYEHQLFSLGALLKF